MMKHLIFCAVATLSVVSSSQAADLLINPSVTAPVASADDWTGFYAGVHSGFMWADMNYGSDEEDGWLPEGVFVGGQLGANWQSGQLVLGVEGDLTYGGMVKSGYYQDGALFAGDDYYVASIDWSGTLRGRVGYDIGGTMPYLTAGLAAAKVHIDEPGFEADGTHFGWVAGLGVETKLDENWSLKGEYLYSSLGETDYYDQSSDLSMHSVRVGLNYRF